METRDLELLRKSIKGYPYHRSRESTGAELVGVVEPNAGMGNVLLPAS